VHHEEDIGAGAAVAPRRRGRAILALLARLAGVAGGLLSLGTARAVDLPADHAEAMFHLFDGGGTRASGPALLVRKSIADKFSISGQYFVDMVSNASIDVVTQASPYKETRNEFDLSADYVVRDTQLTLSSQTSREPDYRAQTTSLDVTQEVFGGMTTVSTGFGYGSDHVGKHLDPEFADTARHWNYRLGATQILTPRWLMSANFEAIDDDGYLGSPYRAARVFGAFVPENDPRTRASKALELRAVGDIGSGELRQSVHASWRLFRDSWGIHANTFELGSDRYLQGGWRANAFMRYYTQQHALFYSDNAETETLYISRNRQLSTFHDLGLGVGLSRIIASAPGRYEVTVRGNYEFMMFRYADFTDVRTGTPYGNNASVAQLELSANF
jgi:hypothetical protein